MTDGYMIITEKDWENANEKQRSWMMFNTIQNMNGRLKALEKRSLTNKVITFLGGMVGGALAFMGFRIAQQ